MAFPSDVLRAALVLLCAVLLMAMGACACSGGMFKEGYASAGGVDKVLPVDVYIPGCPPRPEAIIHAFLVAVGKLEDKRR